MTRAEMGNLGTEVRKTRGYCLDTSDMLGFWLKRFPNVNPEDARGIIGIPQTVPFPSIRGKKEGPCPVYPERPYYDARFHEGIE